jgi:hypothetical protein
MSQKRRQRPFARRLPDGSNRPFWSIPSARLEPEHPMLFLLRPADPVIDLATLLLELIDLGLEVIVSFEIRRWQAPVPLASGLLPVFVFPPSLHE